MRKKLFTLLLAMMASFGMKLYASNQVNGIWYEFDMTNHTAMVTYPDSPSSKYSGSIVIPETVTLNYVSYSVTGIGDRAFDRGYYVTSVIIPNSIISIGDYAFQGCNFTSFTIPNSVISIGDYAFDNCSSLISITIGNSVERIGNYAFAGCSSLPSIDIPSCVQSIGTLPFSGCRNLPIIDNCRYAGTYLVEVIDITLSSYSIQEGTVWIGDGAFHNCSNLTSIDLPNTVKHIESMAFDGCYSLTSINIPDGVLSIKNQAFYDCHNLTSITIPNSVTYIGTYAFRYCHRLSSSIYNSHVFAYLSMGVDSAVSCIIDTIKYEYSCSYIMPDGIEYIAGGALCHCSLTSLTLPTSITSIGPIAFGECDTIVIKALTPPNVNSDSFNGLKSTTLVFVPNINAYKEAQYWGDLNLVSICNTDKLEKSTSVIMKFTHNLWKKGKNIISCGIEGGEQQPGNVLEYIGLEPNSEYKDIPIVLTSNTGETDTVNVSFTTTALELTTKPSKPVSATTAILLAETNMSDAEVNCGFEYKRNDAPADMAGTKVFCPVASGQMAGRLKNLKDDVYYKYRAFYQSAAGNMYYGDWQYIFTDDVAVEFDPILYTYGATVVRENEATISGYALAGSEDFSEQGFEYWAEKRVNGQNNNAPRRMPAGLNEHFFVQASGIALRATLTDLDAGTVYKYRVYGKVGDQYYYGSEQSFTTQGTYEGDDSEAIEEIQIDPQSGIKAQKILCNGQIFILRGEKVYNAQGAFVK